MESSLANLLYTPPSDLSECVYLLPAAAGGRYKLGHTKSLPKRIASVQIATEALDLNAAVVIKAKDRRAALDLEFVLKMVFSAPAWRTEPAVRIPRVTRTRAHNGSSEWYVMNAFGSMIEFVRGLIQHDQECGNERFALMHPTPWLKPWCQQARVINKRRQPSSHELEAENRILLAQAEENFLRLQEWLQARRPQLVEVRPTLLAGQRVYGRIFVFRREPRTTGCECEFDSAERKEPASLCKISYRDPGGLVRLTYFASEGDDLVHPSMYSVELMITEACEQAMAFSPGLHRLLSRIKAWLSQTSI